MHVVGTVFVVFLAAVVAGEIFERLRLPAIAGELLAGVMLGPHVAGVVDQSDALRALAALGLVVLLFVAGLETPLSSLAASWGRGVVTSLCGAVAAASVAAGVVMAFGHSSREAVIVGLALAASSVGVAARMFADAGMLSSNVARTVLTAAVVDDVIVLAALPLIEHRGSAARVIAELAIGLVALAVLALGAGGVLRRHGSALERMHLDRTPFVLALAFCLGMAALAERAGLAALLGAFVAGMALSGVENPVALDRLMKPLYEFLVPFFFVTAGMAIDPSRIGDAGWISFGAIAITTIAAKLLGCAAGAYRLRGHERLAVGAAMIARSEVPLIVASTAVVAGRISPPVQSMIVAVVVVTTLVASPILAFFLRRLPSPR